MPRLILFNKPYGVLCQFRDKDGRPVLADHLSLPGVYPAGRLDHDSEGLLLLTDDGALQARIADPRWKLPKTYWVQVEGDVGEAALGQLRRGVRLNDGPTLPADAALIDPPSLWERTPPIRYRARIPTCWLAITLREGRNRQVRRMTAAVGHPTLRLVRAAVGPWSVAGLAPGEWRKVMLSEADIAALFPEMGRGAGSAPGRTDGARTGKAAPASATASQDDGRPRRESPMTRRDGRRPPPSDAPPRRRSPSLPPSGPSRPPTPSSRKGHGS